MGEGHVGLRAVGVDAPRRLGRKAEQGLDGRRSLRTRLEFKHLAEQRQRDDHRSRLEINRHAAHRRERRGEHAGRHRGDRAVEEGGGRAQTDQRPHVRAAVDDRLCAAHEEWPARPQHDRQAQYQFDPALRGHLEPLQAVAGHGEHGDDDRERQCPEEATLKILQLGALAVVERRRLRLQRHAALGAVARMILANLRVHRTGVDDAGRRGVGLRQCCRGGFPGGDLFRGGQVFAGVGREFGLAAGAAEVEGSVVRIGCGPEDVR